jgi:hypothetical protein
MFLLTRMFYKARAFLMFPLFMFWACDHLDTLSMPHSSRRSGSTLRYWHPLSKQSQERPTGFGLSQRGQRAVVRAMLRLQVPRRFGKKPEMRAWLLEVLGQPHTIWTVLVALYLTARCRVVPVPMRAAP